MPGVESPPRLIKFLKIMIPSICEIFDRLQANRAHYLKWCRRHCSTRDKPRAATICFLLAEYVLEAEALELRQVEHIDNCRDLYLVDFLNKTHVFFQQGGSILHSFRNRHEPKLERPSRGLRRALGARKLGSIARFFNALPVAIPHNDGYDIFHSVRELNQFGDSGEGLGEGSRLKIYKVVRKARDKNKK